MRPVPEIALPWLIELINEHAPQARRAAGEQDDPYPDISRSPDAPRMSIMKERELAEIAERLWPVFGAPTQSARVKHLNGLLRSTDLSPRLDARGTLDWTTGERSSSGRLLAGCTATLLELVSAHGWQRLGTCSADNCLDVYADAHGRGSRRYCSHTCLNRTRVRAYRSRQHTSRASGRPR